eukprot:TRINITY_DN4776_c0_g1_i1.p1 TRINITY_DN4776_c0_g1~~TRINITY_DN4776_c0_g1_i1.p1  ORF type:complete len:355 (-),score=57.65 TRINITY_DN4776_c0_g1_i1:69-1133(-)
MGNTSVNNRISAYIADAEEHGHLDLTAAKPPVIESFPWNDFLKRDAVKSLRRIDLVRCQLTELPPILGDLPFLEVLRFADNRIRALPEELFNCVTLQALNFNANQVTVVQENISRLTNLTELQFSNNEVRTLPRGIESLRKLKSLNIDKNHIDFSSLSESQMLLLTAVAGQYYNQRSPQEILPGLYIGSMAAAKNLSRLKELGITHVVTIAAGPASFPGDFDYLLIDIGDAPWEDIKQYFPNIISFIENCLDNGGKVLVHCVVGASRSATAVIAYLMKKQGMRYDDALKFLRKKRPFVWPNLGFQQQLIAYDEELFPPKTKLSPRRSKDKRRSKHRSKPIPEVSESSLQETPSE